MHSFLPVFLVVLLHASPIQAQEPESASGVSGIVTIPSNHSVSETIDRLEAKITARGLKVFSRIDFAADAVSAGLTMHQSQLLIFGNPRAGTPLMRAVPESAIDLPLKALCWEDDHGSVWLTYNSPSYLRERHNLPDELVAAIGGFPALLHEAAK